MPNRILREGILTSPRMARLQGWADEVFYRRLMSVVDDFGRYYADPGLVRAACYPRQLNKVSDSDIGKWLTACVNAALVRVYPAQDGESYLQLLDFKQQARATKSKFPQPPSNCAADATQGLGAGAADAPVFGDVSEDEGATSADAASVPICPHKRIQALYAEILPEFPGIKLWGNDRATALRVRWVEMAEARSWATADDGVDWFRRFFEAVREDDFLMGRTGRGAGHESWRCDIDYLLTPKGFRRVVEGKGRIGT